NASFAAAASGTPAPSLQWQVSTNGGSSWSNVSGATSSPLTVTQPLVAASGTQYRAVFTNSCGTATSSAATLTVNKKSIDPQVTAASKVYDGNPSATITSRTLIGVLAGDAGNVTLNGGSATFNTKDVAVGKTV